MSSPASQTIARPLADGLRPDPILLVSEWADQHRILTPQASAEPGRWRTARTPYLREIMDSLSVSSPIREVWFMAATQIGKTEVGNNWMGSIIDNTPGPMLAVMETLDKQKRNVKTRIDPMISATPSLRSKVAEKRSRDGGNTLFEKEFPGGYLMLTGANSAVGLKSSPARFLFLDEIDGYPEDIGGEGDALSLASARARTFWKRRKIYYVSSPTVAGRSAIAAGYETTDQRRYFIPCPGCGHMQYLTWNRIRFDTQDRNAPTCYLCEACEDLIPEHYKTAMLEGGEWRPTAESADPEVRGYHLSSLYSPVGWYSWADARAQFLKSQRPYDHEKHRAFVNTVLAETWTEKGEAPDWQRLHRRRESYRPGTVPRHALFLTAGADIQADRIEVEVVGWGRHRRSWSVEYLVFPGDPFGVDVWRQLDALIERRYEHESGHLLPVLSTAVDSGFATQAVYFWARRHTMPRVITVKGVENAGLLIGAPTIVDIDYDGKRIRRGARSWPVATGAAKTELYGWLRQELPDDHSGKVEDEPVGYCHFPEYAEDYFKGLVAEELQKRKDKRGRIHHEWVKVRERNEPLDCRIYARAAAALAGMDRMTEADWDRIERELAGEPPDQPPPGTAPPAAPGGGSGQQQRPRRSGTGYWG